MIAACDICNRQGVPVSRVNATAAYPETYACFICQGEDDPDPYGELDCIHCLGTGHPQCRCGGTGRAIA